MSDPVCFPDEDPLQATIMGDNKKIVPVKKTRFKDKDKEDKDKKDDDKRRSNITHSNKQQTIPHLFLFKRFMKATHSQVFALMKYFSFKENYCLTLTSLHTGLTA